LTIYHSCHGSPNIIIIIIIVVVVVVVVIIHDDDDEDEEQQQQSLQSEDGMDAALIFTDEHCQCGYDASHSAPIPSLDTT
jgi:hypothetical protein